MSKICCFTGHRKIVSLPPNELSSKLENKLIELIDNEDFSEFRAGGATGFDSVAALTVLKLKNKYPHIKLHLFLPCKTQDMYFSKRICINIQSEMPIAWFISKKTIQEKRC